MFRVQVFRAIPNQDSRAPFGLPRAYLGFRVKSLGLGCILDPRPRAKAKRAQPIKPSGFRV